ncbi:MAG TPA: acetolactate decarboxylase, partial [Solirubrobacteraceae bacterium]
GAHLHFVDEQRSRGGHVLSYTLAEGTALLDHATALHVELPGAMPAPHHGAALDQSALHRLESDR